MESVAEFGNKLPRPQQRVSAVAHQCEKARRRGCFSNHSCGVRHSSPQQLCSYFLHATQQVLLHFQCLDRRSETGQDPQKKARPNDAVIYQDKLATFVFLPLVSLGQFLWSPDEDSIANWQAFPAGEQLRYLAHDSSFSGLKRSPLWDAPDFSGVS